MRVLSGQRIRLLRVARKKATSVSDLAVGLKRDTRAVGRDVDLLERFGLLRTPYERTLDMENGESLNPVPRGINS